jgi:hypothetical protein
MFESQIGVPNKPTSMKKYYALALFAVISVTLCNGQLPFKYDSLYKTIHAKDFCMLMQKHPDLLLIDVRSPGEYKDTSRYTSLNQGHLKGAINLNVDDIKNNVSIMNPYKDKTMYSIVRIANAVGE